MGLFDWLRPKPNIQRLALKGDVLALVKALETTDDYGIVTEAIPALADFPQSPEAVDVLVRMACRGHNVYREDAIGALGRMYASQATENPDRKKIAGTLLKLLDDPEFGIRQEAIATLGRCQIKEAVPRLIRSLAENNDECTHAAEALGQIGDASALAPIEARLKVEESDYRQGCFRRAIGALQAKAK